MAYIRLHKLRCAHPRLERPHTWLVPSLFGILPHVKRLLEGVTSWYYKADSRDCYVDFCSSVIPNIVRNLKC